MCKVIYIYISYMSNAARRTNSVMSLKIETRVQMEAQTRQHRVPQSLPIARQEVYLLATRSRCLGDTMFRTASLLPTPYRKFRRLTVTSDTLHLSHSFSLSPSCSPANYLLLARAGGGRIENIVSNFGNKRFTLRSRGI